jgi:hypothetical protein
VGGGGEEGGQPVARLGAWRSRGPGLRPRPHPAGGVSGAACPAGRRRPGLAAAGSGLACAKTVCLLCSKELPALCAQMPGGRKPKALRNSDPKAESRKPKGGARSRWGWAGWGPFSSCGPVGARARARRATTTSDSDQRPVRQRPVRAAAARPEAQRSQSQVSAIGAAGVGLNFAI